VAKINQAQLEDYFNWNAFAFGVIF
jgi:hypothetical protein